MPPWLLAIRRILGKITDVLVAGRGAGLWQKKPGLTLLDKKDKPKDK